MASRRDNGPELLFLAALLSIQIAAGRSTDEISLLASLFTVLGDNLALLAVNRSECPPDQETAPIDPVP